MRAIERGSLAEQVREAGMAVFQFKLQLLPKAWAESNRTQIDAYLGEEGWELSEAWRGYDHAGAIEERIDTVLPRGESYAHDMTIWGHEEHHDIQLFRSEGEIDCLEVPVDLRGGSRQMIEATVLLAQELGCSILVMEKAEVISPSVDALLQHADRSSAAKHGSDPRGFFFGPEER